MSRDAKEVLDRRELFLDLPPDPAHLATARIFAASVARHWGVDEDSVEDLKLAVSEACAGAISVRHSANSDRPYRITGRNEGGRLAFRVEDGGTGMAAAFPTDRSVLEPPTEEITRILGLSLMQSLFPDAEISDNPGGGLDISFSLPIAIPA